MNNAAPVTQKSSSPRGALKTANNCKEPGSERQGTPRKSPGSDIPAADLNVTQAANRTSTRRPQIQHSKLETERKAPRECKPKSGRADAIPVNTLVSLKAAQASPTRTAKSAAVDLSGLLLKELESKLVAECTVNGNVNDDLVHACKRLAIDCVTEQLAMEHFTIPSSSRDQFAQKIARSLKSTVTQTLPAGMARVAFRLNFNLDRRNMLQIADMEEPAEDDRDWEVFIKNKLGTTSQIETSRGLAEVPLRESKNRKEPLEASCYLAQKLFNKILPGQCKKVSKLARFDHLAIALRNFSADQISHFGPADKKLMALLVKKARELMKAKGQSDPTVWTFELLAVADKHRAKHYGQA